MGILSKQKWFEVECIYSEMNLVIEKFLEIPTFTLTFCQSVRFFQNKKTTKKY